MGSSSAPSKLARRRAWRSLTTRPFSSSSARLQSRWLQTIARSASTPRPRMTASDSRSCTASARVCCSSCSFARCANAVFVMATKGTSYGTARTGNESLSASSTIGPGTSEKPKPTPKPRPAIPCLARRRTYARCSDAVSPTPSPVVRRNSPPSSHLVGSSSSETCSQLTSWSRPSMPAATRSSSSGSPARSRTVSIRALSTWRPKGTPEAAPRQRETRRSGQKAALALEDLASLGDTARDDEGRRDQGRGHEELEPVDGVGREGDDQRHNPGEHEDDQLGGRRRNLRHRVVLALVATRRRRGRRGRRLRARHRLLLARASSSIVELPASPITQDRRLR